VTGEFVASQARLPFAVSLSNHDPFDMPFDKLRTIGRVLQALS